VLRATGPETRLATGGLLESAREASQAVVEQAALSPREAVMDPDAGVSERLQVIYEESAAPTSLTPSRSLAAAIRR